MYMSKGRSNIPKTPPATCKALPVADPIVLNAVVVTVVPVNTVSSAKDAIRKEVITVRPITSQPILLRPVDELNASFAQKLTHEG